jgi:hypothetical protein
MQDSDFHVSKIIETINFFHGDIQHDKEDSWRLRGPPC